MADVNRLAGSGVREGHELGLLVEHAGVKGVVRLREVEVQVPKGAARVALEVLVPGGAGFLPYVWTTQRTADRFYRPAFDWRFRVGRPVGDAALGGLADEHRRVDRQPLGPGVMSCARLDQVTDQMAVVFLAESQHLVAHSFPRRLTILEVAEDTAGAGA